MRSKIYLNVNERGFYYFKMVSGSHDHKKTIVWINRGLIEFDGNKQAYISNPKRNAWIVQTDKGALVMRPEDGGVVYVIEESSGYRGNCDIVVEGFATYIVEQGKQYHSPQGNLGETAWIIVNARNEIKVYGKRTGRRIENEDINYTMFIDGHIMNAIEEGLEQLL